MYLIMRCVRLESPHSHSTLHPMQSHPLNIKLPPPSTATCPQPVPHVGEGQCSGDHFTIEIKCTKVPSTNVVTHQLPRSPHAATHGATHYRFGCIATIGPGMYRVDGCHELHAGVVAGTHHHALKQIVKVVDGEIQHRIRDLLVRHLHLHACAHRCYPARQSKCRLYSVTLRSTQYVPWYGVKH